MSQEDVDALKNASAIIERFGGIRPMAAKVGAPVTTVQGWKKRDVIPGLRRGDILKAANENNIDLSDIVSGVSKDTANTGFTPVAESVDASVSSETPSDDVKITIEPILQPQQKPMPSSFTTRIDTTHEELMAAINAGQKKAVRTSVWTTLAFIGLTAGAGAFLLWPSAQKIERHDEQLAAIEGDVKDMNSTASFLKGMIPEEMQTRMTELQQQALDVQKTIETVAAAAEDIQRGVLASDAGSLSDRLSVLEAKLGEVEGGQALADLTARIRGLEVTIAGQEHLGASIDELRKIVDSVDGRMNEFNTKLAETQDQPQSPLGQTLEGISGNDLKAAAMLIAFSQFRESLNRNAPLADDVALLQKLVGEDNADLQAALTRLAPQAEQGGVLTSQGLSGEFKTMAGDIVFSSLKGEDVSISDKAKVRLTQVLNVKKDGELVGGTPTQQAVSKAQTQLDQGDVRGAIATLEALDGPAKDAAEPFIQQAEATVLAEQVQNMLRQMIVDKVGIQTAVPTNALGAIDQIKDQVMDVLPGQNDVVTDPESGLSVLPPASSGFKGFSTTPTE
jgi:hypothetical protein